jgi:hypothetical protein
MRTTAALLIVEGASHLFSEPETLQSVADLAGHWFASELASPDADLVVGCTAPQAVLAPAGAAAARFTMASRS